MPPKHRKPNRLRRRVGRLFGDLRIRPKLIVLHNLFFLVLTCAAYFSLIPLIEEQITTARKRETTLLHEMFVKRGSAPTQPRMEIYEHVEGTAEELEIAADVQEWLDRHPGEVRQEPGTPDRLYRKDPAADTYARMTISSEFYENAIYRAKTVLLTVLASLYVLAVLLLETVIMPRYVYRPIRVTLEADSAVLENQRAREIIDQAEILGDEIGDIMRSRNATVMNLREKEASLERTLARLEELAADLRKKNRMLEEAKTRMAAQDRLASIGLLSASVAHELNTPLSVLGGSIEKLLETVDDPTARRRLVRMQRVAARLRQISTGLLNFSRPSDEAMEAVELAPVIEESWNLVAIDERASRVTFESDADGRHVVKGSRDRLIQLFVNLLKNALYAIDGSGAIVVRVWQEALNHRSEIVIMVEDDGVGIPEEVLPNIFDAFVTSRLDARGTGLGLTVAEGIVHQHGGGIRAANRPEGGAVIEVRLPGMPTGTARIEDAALRRARAV